MSYEIHNIEHVPHFMRRLTRQLEENDLVSYCNLYYDRIRVKFITGWERNYIYKPKKKYRWSREISPHKSSYNIKWPREFYGEGITTLNILRDDLNKFSYMDKELLIQYTMLLISNTGYIAPPWTIDDVKKELSDLKKINKSSHEGVFSLYANIRHRPRPIQPIIEKYYPISKLSRRNKRKTLYNAFNNMKIMFTALQMLIHQSSMDYNLATIHAILYRKGYGPLWRDPAVYKVILRQMCKINKSRTIVDATPNFNEKAITAWALGCKYASLRRPVPQQLIDDAGLTVVNAKKPYDLLIYDNYFFPPNMDRFQRFLKDSNEMVAYVDRDQYKKFRAIDAKPDRIIRLRTVLSAQSKKYNYLFIYR